MAFVRYVGTSDWPRPGAGSATVDTNAGRERPTLRMVGFAALREVVSMATVVGDGVDAPLLVLGVLLVAPAVLGLASLVAVEVRRWWRVRRGEWIDLQSVVRGSAPGLYTAPMPGRLHLTPEGVWWVAEGSDRPVAIRGTVVDEWSGGEPAEEDEASLADLCPGAPHVPPELPGPLWQGSIDRPVTFQVVLDEGGFAEVSVRAESVLHVIDALGEPDVLPAPAPPPIVGRAPFVRLTPILTGVLLVLASFGAAAFEAAASGGWSAYWDGGLWAFAWFGVIPLAWGASILPQRASIVRANRRTLVDATSHADDGDEGRPAPLTQADDALIDLRDDPSGAEQQHLTYRTIRDLLARRCVAEGWVDQEAWDPQDWGGARRVVGARRMNRSRAALDSPTRIPARYLLARDAFGEDQLILFPPSGDVPPIGVIDMARPCLGPIPREAAVELAGLIDPVSAKPVRGGWIVPILNGQPLRPAWTWAVLDDTELAELVTGVVEEHHDVEGFAH